MRDVKPDEVMEELDNLVRLDLLVQYNAGPKTFPKSSTLPASFRYQITPLGRKVAASPAIEDLVVESIGGSSHGPLCGFNFRWRLRNVVPNRRYSDPPFLCRLVDFSFGDPEVVVQPPVSGVVRLEPYRGDDRAVDGRSLLNDAVSFDGDEDLRAVGGGNRPVQVRTPDEIFPPPWMIRPVHRSADPRALDVALAGPEPGVLVLAVRGQPRPLAIQHSQCAKFLEPHRTPPLGNIEGMLFGRCGRTTTWGPSPHRPGTASARRRSGRVASSSSARRKAA